MILKRYENLKEEKFKFMIIIGKFIVEKVIEMWYNYINIIYINFNVFFLYSLWIGFGIMWEINVMIIEKNKENRYGLNMCINFRI